MKLLLNLYITILFPMRVQNAIVLHRTDKWCYLYSLNILTYFTGFAFETIFTLARESMSGSFADSIILARIWIAIVAVCIKKLLY